MKKKVLLKKMTTILVVMTLVNLTLKTSPLSIINVEARVSEHWMDYRADSYHEADNGGDENGEAESNELYIDNAEELALFAYETNTETVDYTGYTIKLAADIDLSGYYWTPVTINGITFDGQNNAILGLTIKDVINYGYDSYFGENISYTGMFGRVDSSTIKNIKFVDPIISYSTQDQEYLSNTFVGVVAGLTMGESESVRTQIRDIQIENPVVEILSDNVYDGNTTSFETISIGSAIGYADKKTTMNSIFVTDGTLAIDESSGLYGGINIYGDIYVGGVVGSNYDSVITNTWSTVGVFLTGISTWGEVYVGGVVGYTSATNMPSLFCVLNNFTMMNYVGLDNYDGGVYYFGSIAGKVYNDSVVNNLAISDFGDMFGSLYNDEDYDVDLGFVVENNFQYETLEDAYNQVVGTYANVYEALNDDTPETGGLWKAAAVTSAHTAYGVDVALSKYRIWEVDETTHLPSFGIYYGTETGNIDPGPVILPDTGSSETDYYILCISLWVLIRAYKKIRQFS